MKFAKGLSLCRQDRIIERSKLATAGIQTSNPIPVCFQSGYLTIKDYDPLFKTYTLDYPNEEVKEGFLSFLVPYFIEKNGKEGEKIERRLSGWTTDWLDAKNN